MILAPGAGGCAAAPPAGADAGASPRGRFAPRSGVTAGDGAGVTRGVARGVAPQDAAGVPRAGVALGVA